MRVFNTLTKQKEELIPIEEGKIRLYACGPTVYNFIHIGNARPLCVFDTLRRYLEWRGYEVNFVQNFTDIDDKIIRRANEEGLTFREVAEKYIGELLGSETPKQKKNQETKKPISLSSSQLVCNNIDRYVQKLCSFSKLVSVDKKEVGGDTVITLTVKSDDSKCVAEL